MIVPYQRVAQLQERLDTSDKDKAFATATDLQEAVRDKVDKADLKALSRKLVGLGQADFKHRPCASTSRRHSVAVANCCAGMDVQVTVDDFEARLGATAADLQASLAKDFTREMQAVSRDSYRVRRTASSERGGACQIANPPWYLASQELVTTLNRKAYKSEVQRSLQNKISKGNRSARRGMHAHTSVTSTLSLW